MNEARVQAILQGETGVARKVYDAVPASEPWTSDKIFSELKRVGVQLDYKTMMGCVKALVEKGLVLELAGRTFKRARVSAKSAEARIENLQAAPTVENKVVPIKSEVATGQQSAIAILSRFAERTQRLAEQMRELGADIEVAAINLDEQLKSAEQEAKQFDALRAALKGFIKE